jgi:large subunit ribosomal protein L28
LTLQAGVSIGERLSRPVIIGGLFSLKDPRTLGLLLRLGLKRGVQWVKELRTMTRRCELTGKLPLSGQSRSHAENATKRKFRPNLVNVTLISDVLDRKYKLRITAHALKSVEHRGGLDAFLDKARDEDLSEQCQKIKRDVAKVKAERAAA